MDVNYLHGIDNAGYIKNNETKIGLGQKSKLRKGIELNDTHSDVEIQVNEIQRTECNDLISLVPLTEQMSPRLSGNCTDSDHGDVTLTLIAQDGTDKYVNYIDKGYQTSPVNTINEYSQEDTPTDVNINMEGESSKSETLNEDLSWLSWMEMQFKRIAGKDNEINLDEFKDLLKIKRNFFAERFFHLFDEDGNGSIEINELMDKLRKITRGSYCQKLRFLFDVYDIDESGTIDKEELKTVLNACMEESSLSFGEDKLNKLTDALFDVADKDRSGSISFDEMKTELEKHPGVLENLTISAAQWLKSSCKPEKKEGIRRYFTMLYIKNNLRKLLFLTWFILINIGLGMYSIWKYWNTNGFIIVARICGMNLNFTGSFVLLLMLRKCITYLRMTAAASILPLDQSILFHKMVGVLITAYSVIHTLAHIGNAVVRSGDDDTVETWEILFTTKGSVGWVSHSAFITGWPLLVIIVIMFICSLPFVRRKGHFQIFYWTHMLYVPFWVVLIIHGPNFWKWFVGPGCMFFAEKIYRSKLIKWARYGKTYIEEVYLLPSEVCHLRISRPENFKYQPGDYIFLQIPVIATQEWHPFTISSAPEMKDHIWLHIRSAGHWTNKLYEFFSNLDPEHSGKPMVLSTKLKRQSSVKNTEKNIKILSMTEKYTRKRSLVPEELIAMKSERRKSLKHKYVQVKCFIDGPYGTATRKIFETEHAVLIGVGIGVTPFASILQSVMYRYKESKQTCPHCQQSFYGNVPETTMKLQKVDFIWINRDQRCFEWFVSLLNQLELEQVDVKTRKQGNNSNFIDMHMYMTAAHNKTDMKGVGLQMALDLMHQKENKDLITGLRTKTQPGRPDWNKVFEEISSQKRGKIKVFFCGAPILGHIIKEKCMQFNFGFSKENF